MADPPRQGKTAAEEVARAFHGAYEELAPSFGYQTRPDSAVDFDDVPDPNRSLMVAVAGRLLGEGIIVYAGPQQAL